MPSNPLPAAAEGSIVLLAPDAEIIEALGVMVGAIAAMKYQQQKNDAHKNQPKVKAA